MQEKRLKIGDKSRLYKFWYDKRYSLGGWKAHGVKGEWYNGKTKIWLPIMDIQTKQYIYGRFFRDHLPV